MRMVTRNCDIDVQPGAYVLRNSAFHESATILEALDALSDGVAHPLRGPRSQRIDPRNIRLFSPGSDFPVGSASVADTGLLQEWELPQGRLQRRLLIWGEEADDLLIAMSFRLVSDQDLRLALRLGFPGFSDPVLASRDTGHLVHLQEGAELAAEGMLRKKLVLKRTVPAQDVHLYVPPASRASIRTESRRDAQAALTIHLSPGGDFTDTLLIYWNLFRGDAADALFLVQDDRWRAGAAAVAYQRGRFFRSTTAPFYRYLDTIGRTAPVLWFRAEEGILHYQSFLLQLPRLQTIFYYGRLSGTDYELLQGILALRENPADFERSPTGEVRMRSKIFLFSDSMDDARETHSIVRGVLRHKLRDHVVNGNPVYLPRTEPVVVGGDPRAPGVYRHALDDWYGPLARAYAFVVPADPLAVSAVLPLARYLQATLALYGPDGTLEDPGELAGASLVYCFRVEGGAVPNLAADPVRHLVARNPAQLGIVAGDLLLKYKTLDRWLHLKEQGVRNPFTDAVEDSPACRSWFSAEGKRLTEAVTGGAPVSVADLEAAYASASDSTGWTWRQDLEGEARNQVESPVNDPVLLPAAVVAVGAPAQWQTAVLAAAVASDKGVPLLFVREPPLELLDEVLAFFVAIDQNRGDPTQFRRIRAGIGALFPDEVVHRLMAIPFGFVLLFPGGTSVPLELAEFASEPGRLPLNAVFRIGRLMATTKEQTARMCFQALKASVRVKGDTLRLVSVWDSRRDLPESRREAARVRRSFQAACRRMGYTGEAGHLGGVAASRHRVVEALNSGLDIFHFSGHASTSSSFPGSAELALADARFPARELANDVKFSRPVVAVLNACSSGKAPGPLPDALMRAGATATVATLWPVFDDEAASLGSALVDALVSGRSLGAALLYARHAASPAGRSVTAQAFILYGDPTAVPFLALHESRLPQRLLGDLYIRDDGPEPEPYAEDVVVGPVRLPATLPGIRVLKALEEVIYQRSGQGGYEFTIDPVKVSGVLKGKIPTAKKLFVALLRLYPKSRALVASGTDDFVLVALVSIALGLLEATGNTVQIVLLDAMLKANPYKGMDAMRQVIEMYMTQIALSPESLL